MGQRTCTKSPSGLSLGRYSLYDRGVQYLLVDAQFSPVVHLFLQNKMLSETAVGPQ